jgi:hypothetical protein
VTLPDLVSQLDKTPTGVQAGGLGDRSTWGFYGHWDRDCGVGVRVDTGTGFSSAPKARSIPLHNKKGKGLN